MANRILLDTGPLVALLSRNDSRHPETIATWNAISPPLVTCWPVLTEAAWLLRTEPRVVERMLASAAAGLFHIASLDEHDAVAISSLMERHRKLKPQLADAALVHVAHRERISTVFTFDQRDFRVYRAAGNKPFEIIP